LRSKELVLPHVTIRPIEKAIFFLKKTLRDARKSYNCSAQKNFGKHGTKDTVRAINSQNNSHPQVFGLVVLLLNKLSSLGYFLIRRSVKIFINFIHSSTCRIREGAVIISRIATTMQ